MDRVKRLLGIRKQLLDFERCLDEAEGNVSVAFDKWLEEYRMLGVVEAIGFWVNDGWSEEQVRGEICKIVELIDEELEKMGSVSVCDVMAEQG
jgi:hypothetical protein